MIIFFLVIAIYPWRLNLNEKSTYINLGDWITHFTYGEFDGKKVALKKWETSIT